MWMSAGTVASIVYYGVEFLNPQIFILCAFLISCFVSFLIGTSFGTVGTVGVALMVIARSGGVNVGAVAGAIISGAYFGDRCSPMSSSANLVAVLTETNIYKNIKNMIKTSIIPFFLSVILYTLVSLRFPLNMRSNNISYELTNVFSINIVMLLPAIIILVLSIFKVNVKISMFFSIISAVILSMIFQHYTFIQCVKYIVMGYNMEKSSYLSNIIKGGGVISMLKTSLVVFISSSFSGVFEGTKMLEKVEDFTRKANSRFKVFKVTVIISVFASIFACSQALAIILTDMLCKKAYKDNRIDKYQMAVDIENSAIVAPAIIPWNIALLLPMVNLGANSSCIPYLFYLYLLPICNLLYIAIKEFKSTNIQV